MTAIASVLAHREVTVGTSPAEAGHASDTKPSLLSRLRRHPRRPGTLAATEIGERAVVLGIGNELDPAAARRLVDLGFAPGATVEVIRRAPLADPTVFRVADTEIALRRSHAEVILVTADLA